MTANSMRQRLLAEVFGTGFLVFIGVGSVPATLILLDGSNAPFTMAELGVISFAFAMIVIAMVYTLGHISGCHINPAVTLALTATGKFPLVEAPAYIGAQVVGAVLGSLAIIGTLGQPAVDAGLGVAAFNPEAVSYGQAMFAELIGTFLLVFTVFGVIDRRAPGGWAGLAIGFVVFAVIIVVGPATSAAINPARTVGPMIILQAWGGAVAWSQLPAYLIGEFAGGVLAGVAYLALAREPAPAPAEVPQRPLQQATTES